MTLIPCGPGKFLSLFICEAKRITNDTLAANVLISDLIYSWGLGANAIWDPATPQQLELAS